MQIAGTYRWQDMLRLPLIFCAGFCVAGLLLFALGLQPITIFAVMLRDSFGSNFGFAESLVYAIPILLCALAAALPASVGLINIGGEGQFYLGAIGGTAVVLLCPAEPAWILIPSMLLAAFGAGALWGALAGACRVFGGVSETLVTLLLNFVAILALEYLVRGPWRDPESFSWPYSAEFPPSAILPVLGDTRLHIGLLLGLTAAVALGIWGYATVWGFNARIIEGNLHAAKIATISVNKYILFSLAIGGGLAALAGIAEVSAIQGRLRPGISPGYGYNGFLVAWLARHRPLIIVPVSVLVGGLMAGGDALQIQLRLPFATVNMVFGLLLLSTLVVQHFFEKARP